MRQDDDEFDLSSLHDLAIDEEDDQLYDPPVRPPVLPVPKPTEETTATMERQPEITRSPRSSGDSFEYVPTVGPANFRNFLDPGDHDEEDKAVEGNLTKRD